MGDRDSQRIGIDLRAKSLGTERAIRRVARRNPAAGEKG